MFSGKRKVRPRRGIRTRKKVPEGQFFVKFHAGLIICLQKWGPEQAISVRKTDVFPENGKAEKRSWGIYANSHQHITK